MKNTSKVEYHLEITPANAESFGYEWVCDVIYDEEAPEGAMDKIKGYLVSGEYVLGTPASQATDNSFGLFGVIEQDE